MYAERLILETDISGKLKQVPVLPANKQLEAIFLVIAEAEQNNKRRQPHPEIAGKTKIMGNIIDTVSVAEWNLPK
ncbi:MAG: hypothetical protein COZ23_10575 [Hydrogenophilales bacterium CG_4_10_14_3_um_filter_58_23]|nr:MAG: hypothetical protein COX55_00085 [Zetaproteobacteria bacterium CG23_combo_of_CG06-09_8_20_14_all_54_7]PIQ13033.1 MAG: hypothetical protein COW70_06940 [Hydrogenophilales bacterium CG18_big_fil_WC_8_21_14_2_50_58_12]PIX99622.1 MAG: hypothetical protein COZ23_10575 [Hydrogenophilales bacterium CG_4_10_14_3_um_filter_58_23]